MQKKRPNPRILEQLPQALALHQQGRLAEAQKIYESVLKVYPKQPDTWHLLGVIAHQNKNSRLSVELISKAISYNPRVAAFHSNLGNALQALENYVAALAAFDQAIALEPDLADAHYNRGNVLRKLDRPEDAVHSYQAALQLEPVAGTYYNLAVTLQDLLRVDESIAAYNQALRLQPDYVEAGWNKSLVLLLDGQFAEGWTLHEWRWRLKAGLMPHHIVQPQWRGDVSLQGKTLLLHSEQGYGDSIQFCRYVPMLKAQGAHVILTVELSLVRLFNSLSGVDAVIPKGENLPAFDYHCPLISLPLAFKTFTLADVPHQVPYLYPPTERLIFWQDKLGVKQRPRVGLIWNGGFRPNRPDVWATNRRRNMPFAQMAQLKRPDIDFYSLQKGNPAEAELPEEKALYWPEDNFHLVADALHDFADTAALLQHLDLLIAVDTSTVHLAGALGKPVWMLSRFDGCWRWLLARTDSPWYPTLRIFRQPKAGDWDSVICALQQALDEWLPQVQGAFTR